MGGGVKGKPEHDGDTSRARSPNKRRYSVRTLLYLLVAATIAPAALVSAGLVAQGYLAQRDRIYQQTIRNARNLAANLDVELARVEASLRVLSTAPELARGDLAAFHARASDALAFHIVDNYVMTDVQGHQVINTLRPYGTPLPTTGTPPQLRAVFEQRKAVLTGLFTGPVTQAPVIALGVPVLLDGAVVYSLNVGFTPRRINELLRRHNLPEGWVAAVLDAEGVIIGRTRDAQLYVGQPATGPVRAAVRGTREGTLDSYTKDGTPVLTAYSQSSLYDWHVVVGAPRADLLQSLFRSSLWVIGGSVVALLVAFWLATRMAVRIAGSVHGLIEPALALGRGERVRPPASRVSEVDAVGRALSEAAVMLTQAQHQAHHDPLTGVGNRVLFEVLAGQQLARAQRDVAPFAVLAVDLDGFKAVNDQLGHAAGDTVLRIVADRITAAVRASDVVARLGGDEFAVLLADADADTAAHVADKLVHTLSRPYPNLSLPLSASVGIALYPESGLTLAALLEQADRALYMAKAAGKACVAR